MRSTRNLGSTAVLRWGSYNGDLDIGGLVSKSDSFEDDNFLWRMSTRCDNHACRYAGQLYSLLDAAVITDHGKIDSASP